MRRLLLASAVAALGTALAVWLAGGIDARVAGLTIRARDAVRPLAIGIVLLAVWAAIERASLRAALANPPAAIARLAPWLVCVLALITTARAIRYGAFVAGGSDSFGYLSQAYGWASGHLPRPYAIPLTLPFAASDWLQTPLGYWPGRTPHTIVPSYAPGLPLLMAIGIRLADPVGPYLVVPIAAGLFVWATFLLARRIAGPLAGLAAAVLAATSPVALFLSLWAMSDVPSAAIWTAAAAATIVPSRRSAAIAGAWAALGILVRPNLVPLAVLPAAWYIVASPRERWRRVAVYAALVVPAAIAIGALNAAWYGSPLLSGYGNPAALYSAANVWPNLQHYSAWLWQSQSPWIAVAAITLLALFRPSSLQWPIALAWAFVAVTLACYLPYEQYDLWWYARFLLPGLGALFALIAVALAMVADRIARPWGPAAALAVFALIVWHSVTFAGALEMYGPFKESEHKHADVGAFIARRLPGDAVFFALQHSGTIRYYGGRQTLRFDLLDRETAARAPSEVERLGLHPYLAIEDAEAAGVRSVFGLPADRPLPWPYVARLNRFGGISIYDLATHPVTNPPVPIEPGVAPPYSAPVTMRIESR